MTSDQKFKIARAVIFTAGAHLFALGMGWPLMAVAGFTLAAFALPGMLQ